MSKSKLKKKSKKQSTRPNNKIGKKVKNDNKNLNKVKKNRVTSIPNISQLTEYVTKEVEALKKLKEDKRHEQRELAKQQKLKNIPKDLVTLVSNAESRDAIHDSFTPAVTEENSLKYGKQENSLKTYYKEFKKVVEAADVVLEIVDARDPLGTRCIQVEEAVRNANKKLVVVLNKADLIPRANLENWLKYLRGNVLAVPFKASTQNQNSKLGRRKMTASSSDKALKGGTSVGAELLMSLLGNYTRNNGIKTSINVGVVGLPNVGKSSLINSLKRARACNVGSTPGVTKAMQEVLIDSKIKLLDSPGIVFAKSTDSNDKIVVLKNATSVTALQDPFTAADAILQRINKKRLCDMYDVDDFSTPQEFYSLKAAKMGRFKKGGIPDQACAARNLINDWNNGKIKFYTEPPESKIHLGAAIISRTIEEFDINKFKSEEAAVLDQFDQDHMDESVLLESSGPVNARATEEEMEEDGIEINENEAALLSDKKIRIAEDNKKISKSLTERTRKRKIDPVFEIPGNQKLNRNIKDFVKRAKKTAKREQKKTAKEASKLASVLEVFSLGSNVEI